MELRKRFITWIWKIIKTPPVKVRKSLFHTCAQRQYTLLFLFAKTLEGRKQFRNAVQAREATPGTRVLSKWSPEVRFWCSGFRSCCRPCSACRDSSYSNRCPDGWLLLVDCGTRDASVLLEPAAGSPRRWRWEPPGRRCKSPLRTRETRGRRPSTRSLRRSKGLPWPLPVSGTLCPAPPWNRVKIWFNLTFLPFCWKTFHF